MTVQGASKLGPSVKVMDGWQSESATLGHRAAAFWLNVLFFNVRYMPAVARASVPFWLFCAWLFSPALRRRTGANAKRLLGPQATGRQCRRLAKRIIRNHYMFVCDVGHGLKLGPTGVKAMIQQVEGMEHYEQARRCQRGLIIATAHLGSYEVGMAGIKDLEPFVHVLFQQDRYNHFDRLRHALHMQIGVIEAHVDQGLGIWAHLRDALLKNHVVLIQGDRVMPGWKGKVVPFCGGHTIFPTGPARLAAMTGSPILPVFAVRTPDGGVKIMIEPAIDVESADGPADARTIDQALLELAAVIESKVKAYPEQWLRLDQVWCEDGNGDA